MFHSHSKGSEHGWPCLVKLDSCFPLTAMDLCLGDSECIFEKNKIKIIICRSLPDPQYCI